MPPGGGGCCTEVAFFCCVVCEQLWTVEKSNPSGAHARDFANAVSGKGLSKVLQKLSATKWNELHSTFQCPNIFGYADTLSSLKVATFFSTFSIFIFISSFLFVKSAYLENIVCTFQILFSSWRIDLSEDLMAAKMLMDFWPRWLKLFWRLSWSMQKMWVRNRKLQISQKVKSNKTGLAQRKSTRMAIQWSCVWILSISSLPKWCVLQIGFSLTTMFSREAMFHERWFS